MGNIIENQSLAEVKELTDKEDINILYFGAEACSVCHAVFPKLLEITKELSVQVLKVDSQKSPDISGQFVVFTVPTILVFYKSEEVLRESRFIDFDRLQRILDLVGDTKE